MGGPLHIDDIGVHLDDPPWICTDKNGFHRVVLNAPKQGAYGFVVDNKGIYVCAEQPGIFHHLTCPHAGSGTISVLDGKIDWKTGQMLVSTVTRVRC